MHKEAQIDLAENWQNGNHVKETMMAQQVPGLVAKSDDSSSIPGTYVVGGETGLQKICVLTHKYTQ